MTVSGATSITAQPSLSEFEQRRNQYSSLSPAENFDALRLALEQARRSLLSFTSYVATLQAAQSPEPRALRIRAQVAASQFLLLPKATDSIDMHWTCFTRAMQALALVGFRKYQIVEDETGEEEEVFGLKKSRLSKSLIQLIGQKAAELVERLLGEIDAHHKKGDVNMARLWFSRLFSLLAELQDSDMQIAYDDDLARQFLELYHEGADFQRL